MNNLSDRVSYLQGLAEGLKLDTEKSEGKLIEKILELLADVSKEIDSLRDDHEDLSAYVEAIDNDLSDLEDAIKYVKENMSVTIRYFKGQAFSVEAPNFVELEITKTEPGFKGDTATNNFKPAVTETGLEIQVPLFINIGDVIKIDTRTGEYLSRA